MTILPKLLEESADLFIILTILIIGGKHTRLVALFFILFILYFHRSPNLESSVGISKKLPKYITSPCFGTVKKIDGNRIQIFLGLTDIHIQYAPCDSMIIERERNKAGYWPANIDLADNNTSVTTQLRTKFGQVTVRQISGVLARKIIVFGKVGDKLKRGDQFGFIRFGSRVDITVPPGSTILVKPGDKVKGPHSVISVSN